MLEQTVRIVNTSGLHARPASRLAHLAGRFQAEVMLDYAGQRVNAKSVLGLLSLAAPPGSEIRLLAEGEDAAAALAALAELFACGFDETSP